MSDPKGPPRAMPQQQNLQIAIDENEGQGVYANLALIAHSNSEFILDFARAMPGLPKAKVHARVILTPGEGAPTTRHESRKELFCNDWPKPLIVFWRLTASCQHPS
jgi:hypothetical protein